jgi:hypothetical protein
MSQANMTLGNVARTLFRANLNDALAALASCQSGTSRPTGIPAGGLWVNTTTATAWVVNLFDGTDDIAIGTLNTTTNVFTPSIANNSLPAARLALGAWTTVASAATVDLGAQTSRNIALSGTTGITSFGSTPTPDNLPFNIRSTGAITITHSANLICPGGANLTLAAGDTFTVVQEATGVWRIIGFQFGTNPSNAIPVGTAANNLVRLTSGSTTTGTYSRTGTTVTVTITAHGYTTGQFATLTFTTGTATSGTYQVTSTGANTFTVVDTVSGATSGNVSAQGPVALPAVSGANITNVTKLLASGTVSTVAQLDLVLSTYIAAGYTEFDLRISNLVAATNNTVLTLVVSTDGGATYQTSGYKGGGNTLLSGSTASFAVVGSGQSLNKMSVFDVVGNTTVKAATGVIKLFCKPQRFALVTESGSENPSSSEFITTRIFGWGDQTNVNAIRLQFATGNITSLTYSLVGVA